MSRGISHLGSLRHPRTCDRASLKVRVLDGQNHGPCRMGFGSLHIDSSALLVMGEHVEVQMRLVEGQGPERESEQSCS